MAIPYELYIRFLVTKGCLDLKLVNASLSTLSLRAIKQEDLDKQIDLVYSVAPKGIVKQMENGVYGVDFLPCMKVLEVEDLWMGEEVSGIKKANRTHVQLVYDILQDTALRITTNGLLIKKVSIQEITRMLAAKFSVPYKETHFDIYSRFFFNPCRMKRGDWKSYLVGCSEKERKVYFTALTEDVEVLKTELELPAQISVSDTLQWLLTKSFLKAKTFMNVNTLEAGKEAREWISQVSALADKYEKHRSGDQHDFSKSLQLEFDFLEDTFETPDSDTMAEVEKASMPSDADK